MQKRLQNKYALKTQDIKLVTVRFQCSISISIPRFLPLLYREITAWKIYFTALDFSGE